VSFHRTAAFNAYPPQCNRCGSDQKLEVHHRDRRPSNDSIQNLEILCERCHSKEHAKADTAKQTSVSLFKSDKQDVERVRSHFKLDTFSQALRRCIRETVEAIEPKEQAA